MERHREAVKQIAARVREFYERKEPFRISHGSTNSTRASNIRRNNIVDTSQLKYVIDVDTHRRTALVEPNVPMDRLVDVTLKYGLVPPVVMEFPGITVGGGYSGTSGESSSFRHGFFDNTINYAELVLANGDIVKASADENSDLFRGAAGSVGSLGIATLVELRLEEAKDYVEATYHPVHSYANAIAKIRSLSSADSPYDYVDGIMFSPTSGAIITGKKSDLPRGSPVRGFGRPEDEWFYIHVQNTIAGRRSPCTEYIPLYEYLFRYDRGGFWVGQSAFKYMSFPFTRTTRRVLDDFLHTRMLYRALYASGQSNEYIVQDLALPYSQVEDFMRFTHKTFDIWPLWLCPLKQSPHPTMHPHCEDKEPDGTPAPMLNIGLWGFGPKDHSEFVKANRSLEKTVQELGGMKWLYAHTYYTPSEFWAQFDKPWYESLRKKYHAESLPSVYDKVKVDVEAEQKALSESWSPWLLGKWPLGGIWGIVSAARSGDYLLNKGRGSWKSIESKDLKEGEDNIG